MNGLETDKFYRMTKTEHNFIVCSECMKPCYVIHDLDLSECCRAPLVKGHRKPGSEEI
jgi:hypothetical protein